MTLKTVGALMSVAFGVAGFVWGMRHINEPRGLFVTLMCIVIAYRGYRLWDSN